MNKFLIGPWNSLVPFIPEKHLTHMCMKDRTLPGPASCSPEILRRLPDSLLVRLLIIGSSAAAPEVDLAPLYLPNVSGLGGAAAAAAFQHIVGMSRTSEIPAIWRLGGPQEMALDTVMHIIKEYWPDLHKRAKKTHRPSCRQASTTR